MEIATTLVSIAAVHLLAIASPGPTFVVVTSHAIDGRRGAGFLVTFGVLLATATWASLAAAGLGTLITQFTWLYLALRLAGAAYLIYMGVRMLLGVVRNFPVELRQESRSMSGWRAVRAGFLTNISNPKVIAYYASLFGVVIPSDAPGAMFVASVATALLVSAAWWSFVTLFFALPLVRKGYVRVRRQMDGIMGSLLIVLGGRLLVSR
ncbi:LysE family translocator [Microvirga splendida]|nr:LysE family transporter [Microvirga splendida]